MGKSVAPGKTRARKEVAYASANKSETYINQYAMNMEAIFSKDQ
jgi:hypothetical protein